MGFGAPILQKMDASLAALSPKSAKQQVQLVQFGLLGAQAGVVQTALGGSLTPADYRTLIEKGVKIVNVPVPF